MEAASLRILHQALLGEAVLSAGSAVFVSDDEGRYLAVNDAAVELLGYTREEFRALNARDVTLRSDGELDDVYELLKREHSVQRTARLRRKDGVGGTIADIGLEADVGGLPVFVAVTAPIDSFDAEG